MTVWVIISAVVIPLALSEFSELSPWIARHLLVWGAARLGNPEACERYREEWLAGIEDVPGKLTKLIKALSIVCYAVPTFNWRFKHVVYLWPARKAIDAFLAIVRPSLCRRRREERLLRYGIVVGSWSDDGESSITLDKLIELMKKAVGATAARHGLPRSSSASWNRSLWNLIIAASLLRSMASIKTMTPPLVEPLKSSTLSCR